MKHLIAIAILAVVGLHHTALADDPKTAAKQHVAAAKSFHEQRRFADALAALEAAYALDPQPQLLFAMGQLNVRLGRCERAIMFYERFVATKPKPAAAALASEAIETYLYGFIVAYLVIFARRIGELEAARGPAPK